MSHYGWAAYLTAMHLIIGIISCLMNTTAFIVFLRNKMLYSATNLLNAFLAVVDVFLVTFISITTFLTLLTPDSTCSQVKLVKFLSGTTLYFMTLSSVVSVVISLYRYRTTVKLKDNKLLQMKSALLPMAISVIFSLKNVLIPLTGWGYYPLQYLCPPKYTSEITDSDRTFTIYLMFSIWLIPVLIIMFSYYKIHKAINLHSDTLKSYPQQKNNFTKSKRAFRLISLIICAFVCVWSLYFIGLAVSVFSIETPALAVSLIHILVGVSTISNSCLYVLMNNLYRKCTWRLLKCRGAYVRSYASRMLGSNMLLDGQRRVLPEVHEEHSQHDNLDFLPIKINTKGQVDSGVGIDENIEMDDFSNDDDESKDSVPDMQKKSRPSRSTILRLHEKHESARRLSFMLGHFSSDDETYDELLGSKSPTGSVSVISGNLKCEPKHKKGDKWKGRTKNKRTTARNGLAESLRRTNQIYAGARVTGGVVTGGVGAKAGHHNPRISNNYRNEAGKQLKIGKRNSIGTDSQNIKHKVIPAHLKTRKISTGQNVLTVPK